MSLKKFIVVLDINSDQHKESLEDQIREAIEREVLSRQTATDLHAEALIYSIGTVEEVRQINP